MFNHLFNSSYSAGLHTITLKATDNSGMVSEDTATISLYDSTPPVIGTHQEEVNLQIGQTFRFEANVSDSESNNLLFSWDFNSNVDSDSDGDPRNDNDGFGDSVLWSYDASGPMIVVCQIENDAGLVSEFEVLVNVLSGNEDDGLDLMQLGLMAAAAFIVVILIALALHSVVRGPMPASRSVWSHHTRGTPHTCSSSSTAASRAGRRTSVDLPAMGSATTRVGAPRCTQTSE